ncbi:hypothetical protein ACP70R_045283 [Stipagrostis hirtigluma subsp. patula]
MDSSADDGKKNNTKQASSLPEECLNIVILCMAFVYKAMNGLGTLATIWATVVLLGGFATLIKQQDFWYVTVIAFVQSIGILGGYEDPAHQLFIRAPEALKKDKNAANWERQTSWWRRRTNPQPQRQPGGDTTRITTRRRITKKEWDKPQEEGWTIYQIRTLLRMATFVALWMAQVTAVGVCMVLSVMRIRKQDYVDPQYLDHDDHRNIKRSLNIFYGLVLAQGIIFSCLFLNPFVFCLRKRTQHKYKLFGPSGSNIVIRYKNHNYLEFITGNVRSTLNMDLITFAKNLVVSGSVDDQLVGIRAMDRILRSVEYSSLALVRLRASLDADALGKLVNMLGLTRVADDEDARGHAARVVLKLTPDILVSSSPQILYVISSSLLNTSHKKMSNMDVDLVWFGLRILDKLLDNPDNCKHVKDDGGDLLSKIIDLTNRCGHGSTSSTISDSWIEQEIIPLLQKEDDIPPAFIQKIDQEIVVGMSLKILSKLVSAPGEAGIFLRRETAKNFNFLTNTGMILEHIEAKRVMSCLAVDAALRKKIGIMFPEVIKKLKDSLFSKAPYVNITKVAAKLLLLEYTTSEQLNQIQSFIKENHKLEDQSFSVPVSVFIEELDPDQLFPPWMQNVLQTLDLEDLVSAPRVNHSQAAAEALMLLTTGCEDNVVAFLQEINEEDLKKIVMMLFSEDREKEKRRKLAHWEGHNLEPKTLRTLTKIFCAGGEEHTRSILAKLLQNLRAYSGPKMFDQHLLVINEALPEVFKGIIDKVATLEDTSSTNENLAQVKDGRSIKEGKILESFLGLAVQICRSQNADDFAKALDGANLRPDTFVQKLKKILELFKSPTTDFPSIRRSTLELMTWMVANNSSYREVLLQCGVYEQLHEVAKTARTLESFMLFHGGVHVLEHDEDPDELGLSRVLSLATELQEQLHCSPNFHERSRCYREHESTISVLIA